MNAAARAINESNLFSGQLLALRFSKQTTTILVLLIAVLMSALSVVYAINESRITLSRLQFLEQQNHQLEMQWGQLLLEQASLATPGRIEAWASQKLDMHLPTDKQIFVLKTK